MDLSLVILIILIILLTTYLYYRSKQYYNILESFDNNTQSSLSTFYQNSVDSDSYFSNKNMYNGINMPVNSNNSKVDWNGIWINDEQNIYAQFLQNNDVLIIGLSNSFVNDFLSSITSFTPTNSTLRNIKCYANTSIGICKLSNDLLNFTLNEVICNKYVNNNITFSTNNLTGTISSDNSKITLVSKLSGGTPNSIVLNISKRFSYYNSYAKTIVPTINTYPTIPVSNYVYEEEVCPPNTELCRDTVHGLSTTAYNGNYNACGTKGANNVCTNKPKCLFYTPNSGGTVDNIPQCTVNSKVYDYMNYLPLSVQTLTTSSNNLYLCDYLKYFNSSNCNSCIICYVSNLSNAYTLNYEFFGTLPGQNNLTVQADVMDQRLNTPTANMGLLDYYRTAIKTGTNNDNILKALSFTNCLENNNTLDNCKTKCVEYAGKYKSAIGNINLSPCIWRIDKPEGKNLLNSCSFILSTHNNYNAPPKYVEFNVDGSVNLSLFSGGTKQQLMFDKPTVINFHKKGDMYDAVAITANIKTIQGLYLMPSITDKGFFNSNIVQLSNRPSDNGKWLIIGFSINGSLDAYQNINFELK
jgi:hypothetical protein